MLLAIQPLKRHENPPNQTPSVGADKSLLSCLHMSVGDIVSDVLWKLLSLLFCRVVRPRPRRLVSMTGLFICPSHDHRATMKINLKMIPVLNWNWLFFTSPELQLRNALSCFQLEWVIVFRKSRQIEWVDRVSALPWNTKGYEVDSTTARDWETVQPHYLGTVLHR